MPLVLDFPSDTIERRQGDFKPNVVATRDRPISIWSGPVIVQGKRVGLADRDLCQTTFPGSLDLRDSSRKGDSRNHSNEISAEHDFTRLEGAVAFADNRDGPGPRAEHGFSRYDEAP